MLQRWATGALAVGGGCTAAIVTAQSTSWTAFAVIAIAAVAGYLLKGLDGWQRLFAVTVFLLICAVSNVPALVQLSYYPRYLAMGALVLWTFPVRADRARTVRTTTWPRLFLGGLWGCVALAGLSSLWSVDSLHTLQQTVALALLVALVHGLVTRRWTQPERIANDLGTAYTLLTVTFVVSLTYGLVGAANAWTFDERFRGIFANPNMLGMLCAMAIPIGWAVHHQSKKIVHLAGIIPAAITLIATESRTAILATLVGAGWVIVRHGHRALARLAGFAALAGMFLFFTNAGSLVTGSNWATSLSARFIEAQGGDMYSGRSFAWWAALDLWETRPSLGFGYAAGWSLFDQTRQADMFDVNVNLVHNSYLQWLLELGLAGATALSIVLVSCIWGVARAPLAGVNSGLVWAVTTGLLIQVTESAMFGTGQPYPYLFWPAVAAVLSGAHSSARIVGAHRVRRQAGEPEWWSGGRPQVRSHRTNPGATSPATRRAHPSSARRAWTRSTFSASGD